MSRAIIFLCALSLIMGLMVALGSKPATGHGDPEISSSPNPAKTGDSIAVEGQEFEENDDISITLEGVSGSISLGTVISDEKGSFHIEVTVPAEAAPGSYRLRAEGSDAVALADFRVIAAGEGAQPAAHEAPIGFHRGGPTGEVIALAVLLGVLAIVGGTILFMGGSEVPEQK